MNKFKILLFLISFLTGITVNAQTNRVLKLFPEGTILHPNIPYNNDTLQKHLLDIYLPSKASKKMPLVIFVHGGGWLSNDKYGLQISCYSQEMTTQHHRKVY